MEHVVIGDKNVIEKGPDQRGTTKNITSDDRTRHNGRCCCRDGQNTARPPLAHTPRKFSPMLSSPSPILSAQRRGAVANRPPIDYSFAHVFLSPSRHLDDIVHVLQEGSSFLTYAQEIQGPVPICRCPRFVMSLSSITDQMTIDFVTA
uniref:Uncharacterized protein n=1 Tax=Steinernema glaseri TaxID=37863 RepID=A0A1I7ZJ32_9BILA